LRAERRAGEMGKRMSEIETIREIRRWLNGLKNRYRCGDCLAGELRIDRHEIEDAIAALTADPHVLVEIEECGLCLKTKTCLIMH
jgi:hypothetical protein